MEGASAQKKSHDTSLAKAACRVSRRRRNSLGEVTTVETITRSTTYTPEDFLLVLTWKITRSTMTPWHTGTKRPNERNANPWYASKICEGEKHATWDIHEKPPPNPECQRKKRFLQSARCLIWYSLAFKKTRGYPKTVSVDGSNIPFAPYQFQFARSPSNMHSLWQPSYKHWTNHINVTKNRKTLHQYHESPPPRVQNII